MWLKGHPPSLAFCVFLFAVCLGKEIGAKPPEDKIKSDEPVGTSNEELKETILALDNESPSIKISSLTKSSGSSGSSSASPTRPVNPFHPFYLTGHRSDDSNSLEKALRLMQRKKRQIVTSDLYSRTARYRYPLNMKRTLLGINSARNYGRPSIKTMNDIVPELPVDYNDYEYDFDKPSLFRERGRMEPLPRLIDNGHLSGHKFDKKKSLSFLPSYGEYSTNQYYDTYKKRFPGFRLGHSLREPNYNDYSRLVLKPRVADQETGRTRYFPGKEDPVKERAYINALKRVLKQFNDGELEQYHKRGKRETPVINAEIPTSNLIDNDNSTKIPQIPLSSKDQNILGTTEKRSKRAYVGDSSYYPYDYADEVDDAENDLLTREYFKTIARSVGNKRKKLMANRNYESRNNQFTFDRSPESPETIASFQRELQAAEENLMNEADNALSQISRLEDGPKAELDLQRVITIVLKRLRDLEEMKDELQRMEYNQERAVLRKRAESLVDEPINNGEKEYSLEESELRKKRTRPEEMEEGNDHVDYKREEKKEEINGGGEEKEEEKGRNEKIENDVSKNTKFDNDFKHFFGTNKKEECPVLDKILTNCAIVSEIVEDTTMEFVESCLRHEICYMCGSGMDVSQHQCDLLLSASLENKCSDSATSQDGKEENLECLNAAEKSYTILGDPSRYDDKGSCTFDPCIRELIDTR